MWRNRWILSLIVVLALGAGGLIASRGLNFSPPSTGGGSEFVREADAKAIMEHVRQSKSPVTLVNFWASWCEPCKEEFPSLLKLRQELAARGLNVVFVSVDDPSDLATAEKFLNDQHVDFPTFYKGSHSLNLVGDIYPQWTGAVPATVLFGADLKILDAWEGDTSFKEMHERVDKHLKGS